MGMLLLRIAIWAFQKGPSRYSLYDEKEKKAYALPLIYLPASSHVTFL